MNLNLWQHMVCIPLIQLQGVHGMYWRDDSVEEISPESWELEGLVGVATGELTSQASLHRVAVRVPRVQVYAVRLAIDKVVEGEFIPARCCGIVGDVCSLTLLAETLERCVEAELGEQDAEGEQDPVADEPRHLGWHGAYFLALSASCFLRLSWWFDSPRDGNWRLFRRANADRPVQRHSQM
jgi:hypothetical protein